MWGLFSRHCPKAPRISESLSLQSPTARHWGTTPACNVALEHWYAPCCSDKSRNVTPTHQQAAMNTPRPGTEPSEKTQETARAREDGTARYTDLRRRKFDRQERCQCHQLHLKPTKIKLQTPISRKWRNTHSVKVSANYAKCSGHLITARNVTRKWDEQGEEEIRHDTEITKCETTNGTQQ